MIEQIKNYALTFIDSEGKEVLINSKCNEDVLESKPFYKTLDNAKKNKTKIENSLCNNHLKTRKHWYDKCIVLSEEELDSQGGHQRQMIKDYLDALLIIKMA